jgi:hypothetical protein
MPTVERQTLFIYFVFIYCVSWLGSKQKFTRARKVYEAAHPKRRVLVEKFNEETAKGRAQGLIQI